MGITHNKKRQKYDFCLGLLGEKYDFLPAFVQIFAV